MSKSKQESAVVRLTGDQYRLTDQTVDELRERIKKNGPLLCEFGVPKLYDGATPAERLTRYRHIDSSRVCAEIRDLWLNEDGVVMGEIVPSGPLKSFVEKPISRNGGDSVRFSIRGMVGKNNKMEVITFDLTGIDNESL